MKIRKETPINYFLEDTRISNIFIAEYLPDMPGDCVKVFLYAWMHAETGRLISNEQLAKDLGLPLEDIFSVWNYLEKRRIIRKRNISESDPLRFDVEFIDLKGSVFSGGGKAGSQTAATSRNAEELTDQKLKDLYLNIEKITGRPVAGGDYQKIAAILTDFDADTAVVTRAYKYCVEKGRSFSAAYVREIVRYWTDKGVRSEADAEEFLAEADARYSIYKNIMTKLGLSPSALTDAERTIFDTWLDDYGMTPDEIYEVSEKSAGKRNKFDYTKKVIENMREERQQATSSDSVKTSNRKRFYAERRRKNEAASAKRREEISEQLPGLEALENEIRELNMDLVAAMLSSAKNKAAEINRLKAVISEKTSRKEQMLEDAGYSVSDLEVCYDCFLCKDTGVLDNGTSCACYEQSQLVERT